MSDARGSWQWQPQAQVLTCERLSYDVDLRTVTSDSERLRWILHIAAKREALVSDADLGAFVRLLVHATEDVVVPR